MNQTCKKWIHHGELDLSSDDETNVSEDSSLANDDVPIYKMLHDIYHGVPRNSDEFNDTTESPNKEPNTEAKRFYKLMKDAENRLYPSWEKYSKLSFIVRLFQMKCMHGWSNTSFDSLLKLISDALPKENVLPDSIYEVQKIIKDLGLDYVKIDACVNNCILYKKEYVNLEQCPKCGEKRWTMRKGKDSNSEVATGNLNNKKKGISRKILRYFPIIPRLQRLFMTKGTAKEMRWHKDERVDDGVLQHPADSLAWKSFDEKYPNFASDPRSIRLGLASDGFNPFDSMSPGMDIDVYLQPLVDDLKFLWGDGIETYDAFMKKKFQLHASLLWTINDFPAYGILSGWSTKGKLACPVCHVHTCSSYLKHGRKQCYMGHRRFLQMNHPYHRNKSFFDNTKEERIAPHALNSEDVLVKINTSLQRSADDKTRKRKRDTERHDNWKKKSIFFELPYWQTLLLRHNLDVMHIEKNISESVLGTLLDIEGKTKDTLKSRLDLQEMKIKKSLHPIKKWG
nr:uncharacterized protein LOC101244468 [Solanum lycopersicum]